MKIRYNLTILGEIDTERCPSKEDIHNLILQDAYERGIDSIEINSLKWEISEDCRRAFSYEAGSPLFRAFMRRRK